MLNLVQHPSCLQALRNVLCQNLRPSRFSGYLGDAMGDYFLNIMPRDPHWGPEAETDVDGARDLVATHFTPSRVTIVKSETVQFHISGEDFETVQCPRCGWLLYYRNNAGKSIWHDWMDAAHESKFDSMMVETPCCCLNISLNDLNYGLNSAGFCKWYMQVENPADIIFSRGLIENIEGKLGTTLRVVRVRI